MKHYKQTQPGNVMSVTHHNTNCVALLWTAHVSNNVRVTLDLLNDPTIPRWPVNVLKVKRDRGSYHQVFVRMHNKNQHACVWFSTSLKTKGFKCSNCTWGLAHHEVGRTQTCGCSTSPSLTPLFLTVEVSFWRRRDPKRNRKWRRRSTTPTYLFFKNLALYNSSNCLS